MIEVTKCPLGFIQIHFSQWYGFQRQKTIMQNVPKMWEIEEVKNSF